VTARLVCAILGIGVGWFACSLRQAVRAMRAVDRFLATRDPSDLVIR
jgi:hypothetical protein